MNSYNNYSSNRNNNRYNNKKRKSKNQDKKQYLRMFNWLVERLNEMRSKETQNNNTSNAFNR